MTGQAASRTILSIRSSACAELSPRPTSATYGWCSLRLKPRRAMRVPAPAPGRRLHVDRYDLRPHARVRNRVCPFARRSAQHRAGPTRRPSRTTPRGRREAVAFASGTGAAAAVFDRLPVGANVVLGDDCYQAVSGLVADADLLWLESPSNPLLRVADLPAICAAPRSTDALVVIDSTFATPLVQRTA